MCSASHLCVEPDAGTSAGGGTSIGGGSALGGGSAGGTGGGVSGTGGGSEVGGGTSVGGGDAGCTSSGMACSLGVGACRATGVLYCDAGVELCSAMPGDPIPETCDGIDNDCNGTVDDAHGCVLTLAGVGPPGYVDGPAALAQWQSATDIAFAPTGELYLADYYGNRIRKIASDGSISTVVGDGTCNFNDGPVAQARTCLPNGIGVGPDGTVYFADQTRIRKVSNGIVSTLSGTATVAFRDGDAGFAEWVSPHGIRVLDGGDLLVADQGASRIRRVKPDGTTSTEAGSGVYGGLEGTRATMQLRAPAYFDVLSDGTLLVSETGASQIRWVPVSGISHVLSGGGDAGTSGDVDGVATVARFNTPLGLSADESTGLLYVADKYNNSLRVVQLDGGFTSTFLGQLNNAGFANGSFGAARTITPQSLRVRGSKVYFVDDNDTVRVADLDAGVVDDFSGLPVAMKTTDGPVATAHVYSPNGLARAADGTTYFIESADNAVRRLTTDGRVETLVPPGPPTYAEGPFAQAHFALPRDIALGPDGQVYIADQVNQVIRRLDLDAGTTSLFAGTPGNAGYFNGPLNLSKLNFPRTLAFTANADGGVQQLVVGDSSGVLRRIDMGGLVMYPFAGTPGMTSNTGPDGPPGTGVLSSGVGGVTGDALGGAWVSDGSRVRYADRNGVLGSDINVSGTGLGVSGPNLVVASFHSLFLYDASNVASAPVDFFQSTGFGFRDGTLTQAALVNTNRIFVLPEQILFCDTNRIRRLWR